MKQLIKNVKRLALALCLATPIVSWAAEPIAEWGPGDFPVSARGTNAVTDEQSGVTISKNNLNNTSTSGYIAVSETGNDSGWPITLSGNYSALTVVVAYQLSSSASGSIIALANANGSGRVNANIQDGNLYGGQGSATTHDLGFSSPANEGVVHTLAMAYSPSDGTAFYFDGVKSETDCSGFKEDGNVTEVCLGAYRGPNNIIKGIRYYYVAVYDSKLGDDDAVAACASALDGFVTVSSSGVALDAATYNDKDVTFVGEEGGYLTVDESIALSSLTAAGKPLTIKVNPGATLSAESINAVNTTVDLSGWDLTAFARNAVVGAPYRIWPILSPSATGSITYDTTGATIPSGYTATTVQTAIGPALEFTTELQFGSLSINFCGTYDGVNDSGARVSDNASYSGINHGAFPVIGTSWNDVPGQNASDVAVPTYIDNLGVVHTDGSALVTLSQVKNAWDLYGKGTLDRILYGYCDDGNGTIVTVENIPFEKFRVIAYAATDSNDTVFSPKTINNVVYSTGAAGSTATPTLSGRPGNVGWGATSSRSQLLEGVNYLVSDVISGTTTVTINNPKNVGRAGIPAVQIVEVGVEYAVERKNFDDGDKYTIDSLIDANSVVVTCDGSITIEGTENYTVTERDLEIMDFSGVEGTVTLGEHTQITLGADRQLPAEYNFGTGSTVAIAETSEEYGKDMFSVAGLTGVSYVKLLHRDITLTVTDGVASYGDGTDVKIDGAATMYDATFTNTTAFAYKNSSGAAIGLDTAVNPKYNNDLNDETTGIYIRHHPYVNGAASDIYGLSDFTVLVVGQMSPTHKTQFIHLGSTANTTYTGLLIATTENDDEVIIAPNTGKLVDTSNAVTVSVPNAANARHAYVITKVGNTFTVSVDGIRRGNFTVANGWTIGVSTHSGVQVGSDFGGEIQRDTSNPDRFMAVANSTDETGVVNVIRVFDYAISDAQAEAVVAAYPYVSEGGLYTRTVEGDVYFAAADAWAKDGDTETYLYPQGATVEEVYYNPSATITVAEESTMSVNASIGLDKLTVGGKSQLTFAGSSDSVKVYGAAIINSPVVVEYGALDLSGAPVQLGSDGSIQFDCSQFDMSSVYETTRFQLTGLVDRDDERITFVEPAGDSYRTLTFGYNATGHVYEFVVTPNHEAGSDVYYKSGYFGKGGDDPFKVVLEDGETETAVFPGDAVVIDEKSTQDPIYIGELPENVETIRVEKDVTLSSGDANNVMLGGATVTIDNECTLTIQRNHNDILLGGVTFNGGDVVLDNNGGTLTIANNVAGSSSLVVKEGANVVIANTAAVANDIVLKAGATLTEPSGFNITPTTDVEGYTVESTDNGDTKVWSVVEERCSIIVTCGENGSIDIIDASSSTSLGVDDVSVRKGAVIKVSVTPDLGYKIDFVEVYMGGLDITESIETEETGNVTTATLEITDDTTIAITFEIKAVSFTVEAVANTTVKVMEGESEVTPENGVYSVNAGAQVKVIWEAADGYIVTAGETDWFTPTASQQVPSPEAIEVVQAEACVVSMFASPVLYPTVQAAIDSDANVEVKLLKDIDTTTTVLTIGALKNVVLDLNGNSIKGGNNGDITVLGNFTLKDTYPNSTGRIYSSVDYGAGHTTGLIFVKENGQFNMSSGEIYAVREDAVTKGHYGVIVADNGSVTINGGKITAGWYAVGANNTTGSAMTVNISGGMLVSTMDYALYVVGNMAVTLSDFANVSGAAGMAAVRNGSLTVTGGTFATDGTGDVGVWKDGTGTIIPALALINVRADYAASTVVISGGSFESTGETQSPVFSFPDSAREGSSITISGGTFSSAVPEEFCASGYIPCEVAGGYSVKQGSYAAQVKETGVKFESLVDAVAAATEDQTVTLLKAYTETDPYPFVLDKAITLDARLGGTGAPTVTVSGGYIIATAMKGMAPSMIGADTWIVETVDENFDEFNRLVKFGYGATRQVTLEVSAYGTAEIVTGDTVLAPTYSTSYYRVMSGTQLQVQINSIIDGYVPSGSTITVNEVATPLDPPVDGVYTVKIDADAKIRIDFARAGIDIDEEEVVEAETAEEAAAAVELNITVPAGEVATALQEANVSEATYQSYFKAVATAGTGDNEGKWVVTPELDETKVFPESATTATQEPITQTEELLEAATSDEIEEATIPAVPGIYYSMVAADNLDFDQAVEGDQTLATGQTVTIAKPDPDKMPTGKAVFFRVKASATPNN